MSNQLLWFSHCESLNSLQHAGRDQAALIKDGLK